MTGVRVVVPFRPPTSLFLGKTPQPEQEPAADAAAESLPIEVGVDRNGVANGPDQLPPLLADLPCKPAVAARPGGPQQPSPDRHRPGTSCILKAPAPAAGAAPEARDLAADPEHCPVPAPAAPNPAPMGPGTRAADGQARIATVAEDYRRVETAQQLSSAISWSAMRAVVRSAVDRGAAIQ